MNLELPGVRMITNKVHSLQTTRSWNYLGLSSHYPTNLLLDANLGDGTIIGLLDSGFACSLIASMHTHKYSFECVSSSEMMTGIWPESEIFNDEGLGPIPNHWKGHCQSGQLFNGTTDCNKKLIGAKYYIDGLLAENKKPLNTTDDKEYISPRDGMGHGTHTSSIAAGSIVANASYKGLALGTLRGGAPRARIAMYKVCWNVGSKQQCSAADILKAFDEAIHDGVDVLSVSLASNIPLFPEVDEHDAISVGSFHAVAKGIPVVCSAGNNGPAAQTIQNTAPWIITVAATTIDRSFPTRITLGNNITILVQYKLLYKSITQICM